MRLPLRRCAGHLLPVLMLMWLVDTAGAQSGPQPNSTLDQEVIRQVYDLILDVTPLPPEPRQIAVAAWDGLVEEMTLAGVRGPLPETPDVGGDRATAWQSFSRSALSLARLWPADLAPSTLTNTVIERMVEATRDPAARRLTGAQAAALLAGEDEWLAGVGLGVLLPARGPWIVQEVAPESPAFTAGLAPGDRLLAINDQDVDVLARGGVDRLLTVDAGAPLALTVERPGAGIRRVDALAGAFRFPSFVAEVRSDRTGYLRMRSLTSASDTDTGLPGIVTQLDQALTRFEAAGVEQWVLDIRGLRDEPGPVLAHLLGRFVPASAMAMPLSWRASTASWYPTMRAPRSQRPLAVLVDGRTAGAGQVLAAGLQNAGRAPVIGAPVAGNAAATRLFPLVDGTWLRLPLLAITNRLESAVVDAPSADDLARGTDPAYATALAALQGQPAPAPVAPVDAPPRAVAAVRGEIAVFLPETAEIEGLVRAAGLARTEYVDIGYDEWAQVIGPATSSAHAGLARTDGWEGGMARMWQAQAAGPVASVNVRLDTYASVQGAFSAAGREPAGPWLRALTSAPGDIVRWEGTGPLSGLAVARIRAGRLLLTVRVQSWDLTSPRSQAQAILERVADRLQTAPVDTFITGVPNEGED